MTNLIRLQKGETWNLLTEKNLKKELHGRSVCRALKKDVITKVCDAESVNMET